jgi:hypothetical protein
LKRNLWLANPPRRYDTVDTKINALADYHEHAIISANPATAANKESGFLLWERDSLCGVPRHSSNLSHVVNWASQK